MNIDTCDSISDGNLALSVVAVAILYPEYLNYTFCNSILHIYIMSIFFKILKDTYLDLFITEIQ